MKKVYFVIFLVVLSVSWVFTCSEESTSDSDAGVGKDVASTICKSDSDCDTAAGQKCIGSVCKVPECLKDQDCIDKKKGNKCDLATYTCKTIASDGGVDVPPDEGGTECSSNCDESCRPDKICKNGYCIPYGMCTNNEECPCEWHCNSFESRCEECASDDDCKNRSDGKTKCDIGNTFVCIEPPVCDPPCDPNCQVCKDGNCVLAPGKCCQDADCPSNSCVNYECQEEHQCSDVCSSDQECKEWCKDSSYVCNNNICMPGSSGCQSDSDCDSICGVGQGRCIGGSCQCNQSGSGVMCDACNSDSDCDTINGFVCYEFNNPLNGSTYKACTHPCAAKEDCEAPSMFGCIANGGTLCSCMSAQ